MWRRDARAERANPHRLERHTASPWHVLGALAVRQAHRVDLAVAARWRARSAVDLWTQILDSVSQKPLVSNFSQQKTCLQNSRGRTRPIADDVDQFGIDIFSESCITRSEGPRVGVSLAGSHGSQL